MKIIVFIVRGKYIHNFTRNGLPRIDQYEIINLLSESKVKIII